MPRCRCSNNPQSALSSHVFSANRAKPVIALRIAEISRWCVAPSDSVYTCVCRSVANFQWFEQLETSSLAEVFTPLLDPLGLDAVSAVTSDVQWYAVTPLAQVAALQRPRVSVLVTWSDRRAREVQIEVRSDEPMLRTGTSCEQVAEQLRQLLQGVKAS